MASASGAATIFGYGQETTFGTAVAVSRFLEFLDESLSRKNELTQSNGIRGGLDQAALGSRRAVTGRDAAGDVKLEVASKGWGLLFKHLLGTVVTAQQGGTAAYKHTFTPGVTQGLSLTLQKQLRDAAGTAIGTFTYPGSKLVGLEFATAIGKVLEATASFDCRDEVTNVAAATASYLSGTHLFNFAQSFLTLNGTAASNVTAASIKIENSLSTGRKYMGQGGLKAEQIRNGFLKITGKLSAEFADQAQFYDRFVSDTGVPMVIGWTGPQISGIYNEQLSFTCADTRFTGETPQVKGLDLVLVDVPFSAVWDGTNPSVQVDYITTDTTP